jgi:DNA-binding NarL/FixJ family response regulator
VSVRVLVVDDHPVVRSGLIGMLAVTDDIEVVGEAGDGEEALALVESTRPDVVLMDLRMPRRDGVSATGAIVSGYPATKVLVLTTYDTDTDILHAVEAGATGYLLKDTPHAELLDGIRAASRGETVLAPPVAARLMSRLRTPAAPAAGPTVASRTGGAGRRGPWVEQRGDRPRTLHRRSDRQDPPPTALHQTERRRPHPRRNRRHRTRPAPLPPPLRPWSWPQAL